jgi:hypothetical protein
MEKKAELKAKRKGVQAAAIGAAVAVSAAVGKVLGIHGEVEDGSGIDRGPESDSGGTREPGIGDHRE